MNVLLSPQPPFFPHQHDSTRRSPTRSMSSYPHNTMSNNRKRKADDDGDEMSVSPMTSPAIQNRQLSRPSKKIRSSNVAGRPLTLHRLLETLDAASLRSVLQQICERQPEIGEEVVKSAPKPTVAGALGVLDEYQARLKAAFPYGDASSDYTYYRVKAPLLALLDALADFTPQYLPPTESQANVSLQYLDGATKVIHNLPDWESHNYRHHKENAYDEISRAWALVITEAAKRGGGFVLHTGGWDQILAKHNQQSGGRLASAMSAMADNLGWVGGPEGAHEQPQQQQQQQQQHSILNELLAGNYGAPVRVGPW